jgi:hypothetical protein
LFAAVHVPDTGPETSVAQALIPIPNTTPAKTTIFLNMFGLLLDLLPPGLESANGG